MKTFLSLLFLVFGTCITLSVGTTFERTIDDTFGDSESGALPVYEPPDSFSLNSNCSACTFHPDPSSAFHGTWHDSSQLPGGSAVSVTLSFDGIAISLFCILANTASGGISTSDFAFTLDGVAQTPFTHVPDNTSDFIYRAAVFNMTGLERGTHSLVMTTDNPTGSLMLFDFAQYTFDDGILPVSSATTTVTNTVISTANVHRTTTFQSTHTSAAPASSVMSVASTNSTLSPSSLTQATTPLSSPSSHPGPGPVAVQTGSNKQRRLAPILAGTLIPVVLLALVATIICRRRLARYTQKLEETRVHLPEAAWVHFHDSQPQTGRITQFPTSREKRSGAGRPNSAAPDQPSSSAAQGQLAALARTPTLRTFDISATSPPPGYDLDFEQQQLS